jgi:hypothetical protein
MNAMRLRRRGALALCLLASADAATTPPSQAALLNMPMGRSDGGDDAQQPSSSPLVGTISAGPSEAGYETRIVRAPRVEIPTEQYRKIRINITDAYTLVGYQALPSDLNRIHHMKIGLVRSDGDLVRWRLFPLAPSRPIDTLETITTARLSRVAARARRLRYRHKRRLPSEANRVGKCGE